MMIDMNETYLLVPYFYIVACDVDVLHGAYVQSLNDPQSLASVDLVSLRCAIFEVLLAIGAFSVNRLALQLLNEIEISAWMIVAVEVEEQGSLWNSTYIDHQEVTMSRVFHRDNFHQVLQIGFDDSWILVPLFFVTETKIWGENYWNFLNNGTKNLLVVGKFVFHRRQIPFDNHVIPFQLLFFDLAVTYLVVNDAQSNQSERRMKNVGLEFRIERFAVDFKWFLGIFSPWDESKIDFLMFQSSF